MVVLGMLVIAVVPLATEAKPDLSTRVPLVRAIGKTTVEGESDPRLWARVLALLPSVPTRIVILDLNSLTPASRQRVRGLEAFVLAGHSSVFVIRQGSTLRLAELGDVVDVLVLASVIWHEMAHLEGLGETAALGREQELWREFVRSGRVDAAAGMTYAARLEEERCPPGGRPVGEVRGSAAITP